MGEIDLYCTTTDYKPLCLVYTFTGGEGVWGGDEIKTMLEYKIVKMRPIKSALMWNYCPLISEDKRSLGEC